MTNNNPDNIDPDSNFFNDLYDSLQTDNQSLYYDYDSYNKLITDNNNALNVMHINIRSFYKHIDELEAFLSLLIETPHIIVISETWLKNNNCHTATITGYTPVHCNRESQNSGGISIYIKNEIDFKQLPHLTYSNQTIESLAIEVSIDKKTIIIVGIYRPHSDTIFNFQNALNNIIHDNSLINKSVCITGDFNINLLNTDNNNVNNFINNMHSSHFITNITKPTRFPPNTNDRPSLIDHVWVNCLNKYTSGIIQADITDHCPVFNIFDLNKENNPPVNKVFRPFSINNFDLFSRKLCTNEWQFYNKIDINDKFSSFISELNKIYTSCFPLKTKQLPQRKTQKPWMTAGLINSVKIKDKNFRKFRAGLISAETKNRYKNLLTLLIRKSKNDYYANLFTNNRTNLKRTWNIIKSLTNNNNTKKRIKEIVVDNKIYNSSIDIANNLNNFFATIAEDLDKKLPPPIENIQLPNLSPQHSFYLRPISNDDCIDIIAKLKNKNNGINNITTSLIKRTKHLLAPHITFLVNESFKTGVFPAICKEAIITPIFKDGDKTNMSNYRPISVLPFMSKILERAMSLRILHYLDTFKFISKNQYGFQRKISTSDAITDLTEQIYKNLDDKEHTIAIFLDLKKAFDTVNHDILIRKLQNYGCRGIPLNWFHSFLRDRKQCVKIGDAISEMKTVNIGVAQGSILGPLLFLLYINDFPVDNNYKIVLYADDTTLIFKHKNLNELIRTINISMKRIYSWLVTNRLSLNYDKTYPMLFSNRIPNNYKVPKIMLNRKHLKLVDTVKYLGVVFDNKLSFKDHITHITNKISKTIGIFYKLRHYLPMGALTRLYNSLIYPYLIYCISIWGATSRAHTDRLLLLQKKIVRIITHSNYLDHSNPLFHITGILKFEDLFFYLLSIDAYKININNAFTLPDHQYATRNRNLVIPARVRLQNTSRTKTHICPQIWNKIPPHIKSCDTLNKFKLNLKSYLIQKYTESR